MPRTARYAPKGLIYHAMNRAVARLPLFQKAADYEAFERVVEEAHQKFPIEILAYCVMPNHWHFVLRPTKDGQLTAFLRAVAHTHTMRWHAHHQTSGTGHLYQGRFKAFPLEDDEHFYTVVRYVERNPLCQLRGSSAGLALVEPVAARVRQRGITIAIDQLAVAAAPQLAGARQCTPDRNGSGGRPTSDSPQQSVRRSRLAAIDGQTPGPGIDAASAGPAAHDSAGMNRVASPFSSLI